MKRLLKWLGLALLAVVVALAILIGVTFAGNAPLTDGQDLGGVRLVKDGMVAAFVVDTGEKEVALVDSGNDAAGKAILAELSRRGLGPDAVKAIFLTHGHPDHVKGVHLFPQAAVFAMKADVDLAEGRARSRGPATKLMPIAETLAKVTKTLEDGEKVKVGAVEFQAFLVPGHTQGSAAYLARGVLFLGDSAGAGKGGEVGGAPWIFSDDQAQNVASLKRLAERLAPQAAEVKSLAFAHSGPLEKGLAPLADFAKAR
jgi:glyoxylase-like metal-dependent hydrolase (beta-lactamase superfamily II)